MEGITLETIPTWVPGIILIYTGFIWWVTRTMQIRMDSRTTGATMIVWGILYVLGSIAGGGQVDSLEARVFFSRVAISLICLSQSIPMTISYARSLIREELWKKTG